MSSGDRLAKNAYRILGLSADASASDVNKAAARARRASLLGLDEGYESDLQELGTCTRNETTIRSAIGQLTYPSDRLAHRLLWFHTPVSKAADPAFDLKKHHDDSLTRIVQLIAMDAGLFEPNDWVTALLNWHQLLNPNDYWELTTAIEISGSFEPPAYASEVEKIRLSAVAIAAEPFLELAREAAHRDDLILLGKSLSALGQLAETGDWARAAQEELAQPILGIFEKLCASVVDEVRGKIVRESDASADNKIICDRAYKRFQAEVDHRLDALLGALKDVPAIRDACRENAAECLGVIAMGYTWADQFIRAEETYVKAFDLAVGTLAAPALQQSLESVKSSANVQRSRGAPVSSAPSLSTVNGFGFRLYGQSDLDPETGSYSANHYFTALFIPVFPVGRYRVISSGSNGYRFLGKLPFRNSEKWHLGIGLAVIACLVLAIFFDGQKSSTSSYSDTYSPPVADAAASETVPSASTTSDVAPAAVDSGDRNAIKLRLEAGRVRIAELESSLSPVVEKIKSIENKMVEIKSELDSLDASKAAGSDIDVDHYNSLVSTFNAHLSDKRRLVSDEKPQMDEYNSLIEADKAMVAQYNALGR